MHEEVLNRAPVADAKTPGPKIKKAVNKLDIILKSYDAKILDQAARKFKDTLKKMGIDSSGPIPLPTETKDFSVLKSPHVDKDARQHFEIGRIKRLIQVEESSAVVAALHGMPEIHPSVEVKINLPDGKQSTERSIK
jgi:small subunit ribosomal protein S10